MAQGKQVNWDWDLGPADAWEREGEMGAESERIIGKRVVESVHTVCGQSISVRLQGAAQASVLQVWSSWSSWFAGVPQQPRSTAAGTATSSFRSLAGWRCECAFLVGPTSPFSGRWLGLNVGLCLPNVTVSGGVQSGVNLPEC